MFRKALVSICAVGLAALVAACSAEKSRNPLSPTVAGPIPGVAITAPTPLEPVHGSSIVSTAQPAKVLFENASTNGERPIWHIVEVAKDTAFSQLAFTSEKVSPGPNGRATLTLPALPAGQTYHWRVRAEDGANTGPYSDAKAFEVVPPVVIETPVPLSPINNAATSSASPSFVLRNAVVSGPAGPVQYRVEVATDQVFTQIVAVGQVARSGGENTTLSLSLPSGAQLFWRARGSNGDVTSAWSPVQAFRTPVPAPPPAPPSPGPGPSPGPAGPPPVHCGPQPLGADRTPCIQAVAAVSSEWPRCQSGDGVACHRFVREVARALAAGDPNWGILGKGGGQWQCTATACGGLGGEGFGEDIVAYCTNGATCQIRDRHEGRNDWQGFDIIVAAGIPGASLSWQILPQAWNRSNNFWSPAP
jgi:hypothetical protein